MRGMQAPGALAILGHVIFFLAAPGCHETYAHVVVKVEYSSALPSEKVGVLQVSKHPDGFITIQHRIGSLLIDDQTNAKGEVFLLAWSTALSSMLILSRRPLDRPVSLTLGGFS